MSDWRPVVIATFARIHWRHDFSGRSVRRPANDVDYWAQVGAALTLGEG